MRDIITTDPLMRSSTALEYYAAFVDADDAPAQKLRPEGSEYPPDNDNVERSIPFAVTLSIVYPCRNID